MSTSGTRVVVVGGGISGLTTAWTLRRDDPSVEVVVLERGEVAGGTARSERVDGYTIDLGPNGFLTNVKSSLELAHELGLDEELLRASDQANKRFIVKDGTLCALPMSPPAFIKTPLLSARGKLRVLLEPFVPGGHAPHETVFEFTARRLGREFAEAFVEPMVLGITTGDARKTSLDGLFPRMREMEQSYGSLFFAMLSRKRQGGGDPGGGRLTSFRTGGVQTLTRTLAERLGDAVRTGVEVKGVERGEGRGWRVLTDGGVEEADRIVLATPARVAAELLTPVAPSLAEAVGTLRAASVRVIALGFDRSAIAHSLDGFGFLIPRNQGLRMLGCLWTSVFFPPQAPEGKVLLRVMLGGPSDEAVLDLPRQEVVDLVVGELDGLMGVKAAPELVHDIAWRKGIPQYQPDHLDTLAQIEAARLAEVPTIHLTGNAYRGVGLNDCVKDARRTAGAVLDTSPAIS